MSKERLIVFFHSKEVKRILFLLGIIFLVLTVIISVNPEPFLRFGYVGVFVFALFGPASLLVPVLAKHMSILPLALAAAGGMAINDSVTWMIGNLGHELIPHSKKMERLERSIERYGIIALFFWALIPFPYDLVGFVAGYLNFAYKRFVVATFLGRFLRFIIIGLGIINFGLL